MPYRDFGPELFRQNGARGTDAQLLQAAHHLVDIFLLYMRQHEMGSDLYDTDELPASKEALVNAFRVVIATENRPGVRALLVKAGMSLAQFQDDVGARMSLRPVAVSSNVHDNGTGRPANGDIRRFDRVLMRHGEDRNRLSQIFRTAVEIAEHTPRHHA